MDFSLLLACNAVGGLPDSDGEGRIQGKRIDY